MLLTVNGETFEQPTSLSHFEALMWHTLYSDALFAHASQRMQELEHQGQMVVDVPWVGFLAARIYAANLASLVIYTYRQDGARLRF